MGKQPPKLKSLLCLSLERQDYETTNFCLAQAFDSIVLKQMLWWYSRQRGTSVKFYNSGLHALIYQLKVTILNFNAAKKFTAQESICA